MNRPRHKETGYFGAGIPHLRARVSHLRGANSKESILDVSVLHPVTQFSIDLTAETHVNFVVYNVAGQVVRTLVDAVLPVGSHTVTWDGTNESGEALSSGVYLYRVVAGDEVVTRKMTLLK